MRVFRRKGSKQWWADHHVGGRRHRKSMETADRRKAEAKARRWVKGLDELHSVKRAKMMLSYAIELFDKSCERHGLAQNTRRTYRATAHLFLEWNGDEDVSLWTTEKAFEKIDAFIEDRLAEVTRPTVKKDRVTLGTLFYYMRRKKWYCGANPCDAKLHDLRKPRSRAVKPERCTTSEEDRFIRREGHKTRLWPILLLTRWVGMRRGEACTVRWSEVDLDRGSLSVAGHEGGRKHPRTFSLAPWVVLQLRAIRPAWLPDNGDVPIWPHGADLATDMLRDFCKEHGLRRIEFNDLRASFATECYERGMTAEEESVFAGHSPAVAKKHYLEFKAKKARSKLPPDPLGEHDDADSDAELTAKVAQ